MTDTRDPGGCRGVAVLGSTGSVGRQALEVIAANPDRFRVVALAARTLSETLRDQVDRFQPEFVAVTDPSLASGHGVKTLSVGNGALTEAATLASAEIVLVATSGHAAIDATMRAIESGKIIALANKEVLVCAGEIIIPLLAKHGTSIRPVDSEHSAIWQALDRTPLDQIARIIITASGGPFRTTPAHALHNVTAKQALAHPTWSMGGKITVDSATLMNKGLEVIEAHWLFGLPYEQIDVLVHPESVIHSLVAFVDGSVLAQLGLPDMKMPIQYALTYPDRYPRHEPRLDLAQLGALHFEAPDEQRFPALRLARDAGKAGQTYPTVLSAADDEAVSGFLRGTLSFGDIPAVVESVLAQHDPATLTLEAIWAADAWARVTARSVITGESASAAGRSTTRGRP